MIDIPAKVARWIVIGLAVATVGCGATAISLTI